ncbi:MAG: SRPBCC family protein [Deltaproteobacteria bacterium]|nr:SRPBCC family protein [Deltaproteobacteria bacterium]MBW2445508.1 SRPBCC family protein [Deltaproteobacteria bacterium]
MASYEIEGDIEMSADALWRVLRDFGDVSWIPGNPDYESEGEGVGMVRTIRTRSLPTVRERLDAIDEESRTVHYRVLDGNPMPVDDYRASMRAVDLGKGRSRLVWRSTWEPKDVSEEDARKAVHGLYSGVLRAVQKNLARR